MVITRRSAGGIVAIWVAAVVGVSATAWVAIDRAGRDITGTSVTTMPSAPIFTPTPAPQPTMTTPQPTVTPRPTSSPKPPAAVRPPPPAITPTPTGTPAPSASTRPASPAPPAPTAQDRTTGVAGGVVSMRCTGTTITLRFAQPEFGWRVNVNTYDKRIYVSFRSGEEEDQHRTQVTAVCQDGIPHFTVSNG